MLFLLLIFSFYEIHFKQHFCERRFSSQKLFQRYSKGLHHRDWVKAITGPSCRYKRIKKILRKIHGFKKIKKLIELLNESGVGEIEITEGEDSVRISRESSAKKMVTKDEENTTNSKEIISTQSSNNQNQSKKH